MYKITIIIGLLLILLGILFYISTGGSSVTALIPTFLGMPILILGAMAAKESMRKHAMHVAIIFAMVGLFGSFRGIGSFFQYVAGQPVERPLAAMEMFITFILCGILMFLSIRSFINARRARENKSQ